MKPNDLIEFSQQTYMNPNNVEGWSETAFNDSGLSEIEQELFTYIQDKQGDLLLLGVGGGREAIVLGKNGFQITGVDFVPALVESAIKNTTERGVNIKGSIQEISTLDVQEDSFDVVWISKYMYSCIPTRTRRVQMAQRISKALKPGGLLICQFQQGLDQQFSGRANFIRWLLTSSPLGNNEYEPGDILWLNMEFLHLFPSECEVISELEEGGFILEKFVDDKKTNACGIVCLKPIKNNREEQDV